MNYKRSFVTLLEIFNVIFNSTGLHRRSVILTTANALNPDQFRFMGNCPPTPPLTLTFASHLGQNVGLREGWVGSFPETLIDPLTLHVLRMPKIQPRTQACSRYPSDQWRLGISANFPTSLLTSHPKSPRTTGTEARQN